MPSTSRLTAPTAATVATAVTQATGRHRVEDMPFQLYRAPAPSAPAATEGDKLGIFQSSPGVSPAPALPVLPGNSERFNSIVKQVQTALYSYGYYSGKIDGIVGPGTKSAIRSMQTDWNLKVTGTITPELLNNLGMTAR